MSYTTAQKNLISSLIGTKILPRTRSASLKDSLVAAHARMYDDDLTASDLLLLSSALELLITPTPADENKESYREMIEALMVTRAMLADAEAAESRKP